MILCCFIFYGGDGGVTTKVMRDACGVSAPVRKDGDGKPTIADEIEDDSDTENCAKLTKNAEILDKCLAQVADWMIEKGHDVITSAYWTQFKMPQAAFELDTGPKRASKVSLWSSLVSTNRFRKIVGKEKSSDRYHLCLPTIEPLAKVIDLDSPLERDHHQLPEVFDIDRVQSVLAPSAKVEHNIRVTMEAALLLQKRAADNIQTAKRHKSTKIESLKETQMAKAFASEKNVMKQLRHFIADQQEQAVNMYVCVSNCVIALYDRK